MKSDSRVAPLSCLLVQRCETSETVRTLLFVFFVAPVSRYETSAAVLSALTRQMFVCSLKLSTHTCRLCRTHFVTCLHFVALTPDCICTEPTMDFNICDSFSRCAITLFVPNGSSGSRSPVSFDTAFEN